MPKSRVLEDIYDAGHRAEQSIGSRSISGYYGAIVLVAEQSKSIGSRSISGSAVEEAEATANQLGQLATLLLYSALECTMYSSNTFQPISSWAGLLASLPYSAALPWNVNFCGLNSIAL